MDWAKMLSHKPAEGRNYRQESIEWNQKGMEKNRSTHYSRFIYCPSGKKYKLNELSNLPILVIMI